jgi:hypothetical protein
MLRHRKVGLLTTLVLALVMVFAAVPALAVETDGQAEGSVVVTGQILPYLEVAFSTTTIDMGDLPGVWNLAAYPLPGNFIGPSVPFTVTVTSNLQYGTLLYGQDASTGFVYDQHLWFEYQRSNNGSVIATRHLYKTLGGIDALISDDPGVADSHACGIRAVLAAGAMPIPPGTARYTMTFYVSQLLPS